MPEWYITKSGQEPALPWNTQWSGLRNFLDRFKGISQRFLHLRVVRYEFLHNHGHLPWRQTFEAAVRCMFSTTGEYLRRMAHQHRRMPLTLCYR
jgi:hypothetical protein